MELLSVKWLKPHPEWAYFEGNFAELPADKVSELVSTGHVIYFPGEKVKDVNPLPLDLPCRDILYSEGFDTIEKIKQAGASIKEIKGIGKRSFENVTAFLSV